MRAILYSPRLSQFLRLSIHSKHVEIPATGPHQAKLAGMLQAAKRYEVRKMDSTIVAAIIGGTFAVLAATIPVLLRLWKRRGNGSDATPGDKAAETPEERAQPVEMDEMARQATDEASLGYFTLSVRLPPEVPEVYVEVNGVTVFQGGVDQSGMLNLKVPMWLQQSEPELRVHVSVPGFRVAEHVISTTGGETRVVAHFEDL